MEKDTTKDAVDKVKNIRFQSNNTIAFFIVKLHSEKERDKEFNDMRRRALNILYQATPDRVLGCFKQKKR